MSQRHSDPKRLYRGYGQVYSQNCEDGYIAEIFSRIGTVDRTFLEIGIENGLQNTTRFLLEQGWSGIWIEGDPEKARQASAYFSDFIKSGALTVISKMVDVTNINGILNEVGAPEQFDLISVDVDYNTSHIWRALDRRARVSCIEYNASIPPSAIVEVPYDPQGVWDGTNYFGAGLKVIEKIGAAKGMALVGCDLQGVNAYLVTSDAVGESFREPFTAENHYELPKYSLAAHVGHPPSQIARRWSAAKD